MFILSGCSGSGNDGGENQDADTTNPSGIDSPGLDSPGTDSTSDNDPETSAPIDGGGESDSNMELVSLPDDCGTITLPGGARFCISAEEDRSLYSLSETGNINFSTNLPDDVSLASTRIISGTNLYVLNPTAANLNNWVVTAIDAGGNVQFTVPAGGNIASVREGFSIAPFVFLHVISPAGESSIIQIDETTGEIGNSLNLAGQRIDRVGSESFDGATFISIQSNGETTYRDSQRLEPYARGFTLSPDTLQTEFSNLMNITRANYLGQFIDIFNQTNAFASTASARTTLPCSVSGTVEILPQSNFFFSNDITRAYSYNECILIDRTINGTVVYSALTTPAANPGNNTTEVTESLAFDGMTISRIIDNEEAAGTFNNEQFAVTASLNNIYSISDGGSIMEINRDVTTSVSRYSQSSANVELVVITDASHQNKTYQLLQDSADGVATARESGTMNLQNESGMTVSLQITEPFFYEASGSESQGQEISQAPVAGLARVRSSDGSALDVNANLASATMQNYLLNQAGMETSIDANWNISPINLRPSLIQLP